MFASRVTSTVLVEDQDGSVSVVVRKLSAITLERAAETRAAAVATASSKWGAEMIRSFRDTGDDKKSAEPKPRDLEAERKARYTSYDRQTVLGKGVVSWTAKERVCPDTIEDLDEQTSQQLHEAILDLSLPSLDPVVEELKAKND